MDKEAAKKEQQRRIKKIKMKQKYLIMLLILSIFGNLSCTPVIKVLPEDVPDLSAIESKNKEIYLSGLEEGRRLCKSEILNNLSSEIEKLKGVSVYEELSKDGFLVPPLIIPMYSESVVDKSGKILNTPKIEWIIVEDAKFTTEDIAKALMKRKSFVFLDLFDKYSDAYNFGKKIEKDIDKDDRIKYLRVKNSNSVAVIVETSKNKTKFYEERYRGYTIDF